MLGKKRQNENTDAQNIRVFTSGPNFIPKKPRVLSFKMAMRAKICKNKVKPSGAPNGKTPRVQWQICKNQLKFRAQARAGPENPLRTPGKGFNRLLAARTGAKLTALFRSLPPRDYCQLNMLQKASKRERERERERNWGPTSNSKAMLFLTSVAQPSMMHFREMPNTNRRSLNRACQPRRPRRSV